MSKSVLFPMSIKVDKGKHVATHVVDESITFVMEVTPEDARIFYILDWGQGGKWPRVDILEREAWASHRKEHGGSLSSGAVFIGAFPEYRTLKKMTSDRYDRVMGLAAIEFNDN